MTAACYQTEVLSMRWGLSTETRKEKKLHEWAAQMPMAHIIDISPSWAQYRQSCTIWRDHPKSWQQLHYCLFVGACLKDSWEGKSSNFIKLNCSFLHRRNTKWQSLYQHMRCGLWFSWMVRSSENTHFEKKKEFWGKV